ncbi:hypothetical protein HYR99_16250 [Candidatus Poribacteria bacterium]|nr:hypothetical protein [Candidatus Poribacteria bacterium]
MPYAATDMTQMMGLGSYVGEVREGPDGQLYEWVQGVDGLGNPIGFWRGLRKAFKGVARFARPLLRKALPFTKFIPGVGPAIYAAGTLAQRAGILGTGQIAEGPDGQLYEYVEGVDGLGNPIGFWRKLRQAAGGLIRRGIQTARGLIPGAAGLLPGGLPGAAGALLNRIPGIQRIKGVTSRFCQVLPQLEPCVQQIPEARRPYEIGTQVCNTQLYEVVEGIGALGERQQFLRPVWLSIPAAIRPRGVRRGVRPGIPRPQAVPAGVRPPVPTAVPGVRPPIPTPGVRAFRRFR